MSSNNMDTKNWKDFNSIPEFQKYIENDLDLKVKDYCLGVLKKVDPISGNLIPFRSLEQYLLSDFENKTNIARWIKGKEGEEGGLEEIKNYLHSSLSNYCKIKKLEYLPSHFELRTISGLMSFKTYLKFFENGGLYNLAGDFGILNRFSYHSDLKKPGLIPKSITIDTREKKPMVFLKGVETIVKKLDYGDYNAGGELFIERKSLGDLVSTLSGGWGRFNREMERVEKDNKYCVILVDCDINDFLSFKYSRECRKVLASQEFILKRARDLIRRFPRHIQFLFSGGRKESAKLMPLLFGWDKKITSALDLQFYKDTKALEKLL